VSLRKILLESCNLHTVLDCPQGNVFRVQVSRRLRSSSTKAARRGRFGSTNSIPVASLGKTNPLNDDDLAEFVKLQKDLRRLPKELERGR